MDIADYPSFASPSLTQAMEAFFARLDRREPDSFRHALALLAGLDTAALARSHVTALANRYFTADSADRERLREYLPCFGHVRLFSRDDVAVSYSVRMPRAIPTAALSSSTRDEYHRVDQGTLDILECRRSPDTGAFSPMSRETAGAGQEILRLAGTSAYVLSPQVPCHVFSISGWSQGSFTSNVESATGKVISQAYSQPEDCILANVLELCALNPSPELGEQAMAFTGHENHRVRLAALKAAIVGGTLSAGQAAGIARADAHPVIRGIGQQMQGVAA